MGELGWSDQAAYAPPATTSSPTHQPGYCGRNAELHGDGCGPLRRDRHRRRQRWQLRGSSRTRGRRQDPPGQRRRIGRALHPARLHARQDNASIRASPPRGDPRGGPGAALGGSSGARFSGDHGAQKPFGRAFSARQDRHGREPGPRDAFRPRDLFPRRRRRGGWPTLHGEEVRAGNRLGAHRAPHSRHRRHQAADQRRSDGVGVPPRVPWSSKGRARSAWSWGSSLRASAPRCCSSTALRSSPRRIPNAERNCIAPWMPRPTSGSSRPA